jgi:hypothetical protein
MLLYGEPRVCHKAKGSTEQAAVCLTVQALVLDASNNFRLTRCLTLTQIDDNTTCRATLAMCLAVSATKLSSKLLSRLQFWCNAASRPQALRKALGTRQITRLSLARC